MKEDTLRDFFLGTVSAAELDREVAKSFVQHDGVHSSVKIKDMETDVEITRPMLLQLLDATISGKLQPHSLELISLALLASDRFFWDTDKDELVTEVINDWSTPQINYALTHEGLQRFRKWLLNEEPYPSKPSFSTSSKKQNGGNLIFVRQKTSE